MTMKEETEIILLINQIGWGRDTRILLSSFI